MVGIIRKRIGARVSVVINFVLLIIMAMGTSFLIYQQNKSLEDSLLEKGKIQSLLGAKMMEKILEEAVDSDMLSLDEVFDVDYQQIGDFDPPKFHTLYDSYLDRLVLAVEDEFLEDQSNLFAVAVDINGYVPTHNTRYQKPITGDKEKDRLGNRTKRIFNDPIGIKAATTTQKGFLQVYNRDTGEKVWDISSPVFVKGRQWGAFRIGISLEQVNKEKQKLTVSLIAIMCVILAVSVLLTFLIVTRILRPVQGLAQAAEDIASGQNLDSEIIKTNDDEIGELQSAIERLRMSMLIALQRRKKN